MAEQISPGVDYVPHHCSQDCSFAVRESDDPGDCPEDEEEEDEDDDDVRRSIEFTSSNLAVGRWTAVHPPSHSERSYGDDIDRSATGTATLVDYELSAASAIIEPIRSMASDKGQLLPPKKRAAKASIRSTKSSQLKLNKSSGSPRTATATDDDGGQESKPDSRHRRGLGGTTSAPHQCSECQKVFGSAGKLQQHQYVHSGERPFVCGECAKGFSSRFKLMRHALIHAPPSERRYKCPCCERSFHRKDHLKNHAHVHDPNKATYKCPECPKEYNSRLSYRKHVAVHAANSGDLECKVCLKRFASTDEIVFHLKVHSGSRTIKTPNEKKFKCDFCERRFFTRKDVKRHLVVHTGRRDFLCQLCPQRFGRKDHLVRHLKKSHHPHHHHHHHHNNNNHNHSHHHHHIHHPVVASFPKMEKDSEMATVDADTCCNEYDDHHPVTSTVNVSSTDYTSLSPSLELVYRHHPAAAAAAARSSSLLEANGAGAINESIFSVATASLPPPPLPPPLPPPPPAPPSVSSASTPAFLIHSLSMDMEYKLYDDIKIEREHDDPNDIGQLFGFLPLSLSIPPPQSPPHLSHHHQHQQHHLLSATVVQGMSGGQVTQVTSSPSSSSCRLSPPVGNDNALPQFDEAFQ